MTSVDKTASDLFANLGLNTVKPKSNSGEMGQDAFLELMITQMNNQDPFKPMENGEFLTQIAQFSQVSGINELQNSFAQLAASLTSSQALQASGLVGRNVLVPSEIGLLPQGGALRGTVELPMDTSQLVLSVVDASGEVVRSIEMGAHSAGDVAFAWDGITNAGTAAAPGRYRVRAEFQTGEHSVAAQTFVTASVDSVTIGGAGQGLTLNLTGLGQVDFAQVREIM